jgi:hypothetical protein
MTEFETPRVPCPACGRPLDRASNPDGTGAPEPGDITVCLRCATTLLFDATLGLKKPSDAEMVQIMLSETWPTVAKLRRACLLTIAEMALEE